MKITIIRDRDKHSFDNVKTVTVKREGWLFPKMNVDVVFNRDTIVNSHYVSKERDMTYEIDASSSWGMGSYGCKEILVVDKQ